MRAMVENGLAIRVIRRGAAHPGPIGRAARSAGFHLCAHLAELCGLEPTQIARRIDVPQKRIVVEIDDRVRGVCHWNLNMCRELRQLRVAGFGAKTMCYLPCAP